MAAAGWTLYSCRLAFIFNLLSKILPVAIGTVAMSTFQRVCLQARRVFTADITREAFDYFGRWRLSSVWPQSGSL